MKLSSIRFAVRDIMLRHGVYELIPPWASLWMRKCREAPQGDVKEAQTIGFHHWVDQSGTCHLWAASNSAMPGPGAKDGVVVSGVWRQSFCVPTWMHCLQSSPRGS